MPVPYEADENHRIGNARSLFAEDFFGRGFNSRRLHHLSMSTRFRLEYWKDGPWFVGRLPQVPGVFSQDTTLEELENNIRDAYQMMLSEQEPVPVTNSVSTKEIEVLA